MCNRRMLKIGRYVGRMKLNLSDTAKVKRSKVKVKLKLCTKSSNIYRKRHPIVEICPSY